MKEEAVLPTVGSSRDAKQLAKRLRIKSALVITAVVLASGLAGAAIEHAVDHHRFWPSERSDLERHARGLEIRSWAELLDRLDLTHDQHERIEAIMERARPRVAIVIQRRLPELRAVTDSIRNEVLTVLTPAQRRKMADALAERRHEDSVRVLRGDIE